MASRTSIEKAALEISKLFTNAQKAILALITKSAVSRTPVSEQRMAAGVITILNRLEKKAYPIIKKDIEWHYVTSAKEASNTVAKITGTTIAKGLTVTDYLNIESLTRKSLNDYGERYSGYAVCIAVASHSMPPM